MSNKKLCGILPWPQAPGLPTLRSLISIVGLSWLLLVLRNEAFPGWKPKYLIWVINLNCRLGYVAGPLESNSSLRFLVGFKLCSNSRLASWGGNAGRCMLSWQGLTIVPGSRGGYRYQQGDEISITYPSGAPYTWPGGDVSLNWSLNEYAGILKGFLPWGCFRRIKILLELFWALIQSVKG